MVLNRGSSDTESEATKNVDWSFGARNTASTPSAPLAPGLLSITTVCPRRFLTPSPTTRAAISFEPPAGNGTTKVSDLLGHSSARAMAGAMARLSSDNRTMRRDWEMGCMSIGPTIVRFDGLGISGDADRISEPECAKRGV